MKREMKMNKKRRNILLSFMSIAVVAVGTAAERGDSLSGRIYEHNSKLIGLRGEVYANPAMQSLHFNSSLTSLAIGYSHSSATRPVRLEYGDGHDYGFGDIKAYLHKGKATIWGNARYYNGLFRNIQFCETSDFETVSPFVMADTVGGDSRREFYHFLGGFSYPVGKFNVGAEGEYTAMLEYRTRDPRPKNLTGDLRAKFGVSYDIDTNHMAGVAVTARKYKQTNEVKLYNEVSVPTIYHYTGLGTDYYRFRGVNTSTYYKGYSAGAMLDYTTKGNNGAFASAGYEFTKIEKIITSLNELPMSNIKEYSQNMKIGYGSYNSGNGFGVALTEKYSSRRGTENIFGTAQDNIFPQISEATQYSLKRWIAGVEAAYQQTSGNSGLGVELNVNYADYDESYKEPARRMKSSAVMAGLALDGHILMGRLMLMGNVAGHYEWSTRSSLDAQIDAQQLKMFTPVAHYYSYLSNDRYNIAASVEAGYCAKKQFMPFIRTSWQYSHYISTEYDNFIEIAVGVKL